MDDSGYIMFLLLGTALVLVDGQIIYRSGLRYLATSYGSRGSAKPMARLVSVLFHFAVLGILALISSIDFAADSPAEGVVIRLGIVLVVLAIAHAVTVAILTRIRDRLAVESVQRERAANIANANNNVAGGGVGGTNHGQTGITVSPAYPEENTRGVG